MRKATEPQTRQEKQASSCEVSGLIATGNKSRQAARTKSVLDNRSHRTIKVARRPGADRQGGAGVSAAFHVRGRVISLRRPAAAGRAACNPCYLT